MLNDFIVRIFFETIYFSLVIFLGLFYIKLCKFVIDLRRKLKISIGHKNNPELYKAIRAQTNFNEQVPLGIILSFFTYFNNYIIFSCVSLIFLAVGRFLHARSIFYTEEQKKILKMRFYGMRFTFYSHLVSIFGVIIYLIQMIYYSFKNL